MFKRAEEWTVILIISSIGLMINAKVVFRLYGATLITIGILFVLNTILNYFMSDSNKSSLTDAIKKSIHEFLFEV